LREDIKSILFSGEVFLVIIVWRFGRQHLCTFARERGTHKPPVPHCIQNIFLTMP